MLKITFHVEPQEKDHQITESVSYSLSPSPPTSQKQRASRKLHLQLDFCVWIIHLQKYALGLHSCRNSRETKEREKEKRTFNIEIVQVW